MATIIEIKEPKVESLSKYVRKIYQCSKDLLECLEEIEENKSLEECKKQHTLKEEEEYSRYY